MRDLKRRRRWYKLVRSGGGWNWELGEVEAETSPSRGSGCGRGAGRRRFSFVFRRWRPGEDPSSLPAVASAVESPGRWKRVLFNSSSFSV